MINNLIFTIENGLAITRFMYDHAIIINALTSFENQNIINMYVEEQKKYNDLLLKYIQISNHKITKDYVNSDILVTKYTELLETKTCSLSRIKIDSKITEECLKITSGSIKTLSPEIINNIKNLNIDLLSMLNVSIKKYEQLKIQIVDSKMLLFFDKKIIDHFIIETKSFIYTMDFLSNGIEFTPTYVYCTKYYLNIFQEEHLEILKVLLEPTNPIYNTFTDSTLKNFRKIIETLDNTVNPQSLDELNKRTLEATKEFINWDSELVASLVHKKYYSTIIEILYDHILREANYTYYLLKII